MAMEEFSRFNKQKGMSLTNFVKLSKSSNISQRSPDLTHLPWRSGQRLFRWMRVLLRSGTIFFLSAGHFLDAFPVMGKQNRASFLPRLGEHTVGTCTLRAGKQEVFSKQILPSIDSPFTLRGHLSLVKGQFPLPGTSLDRPARDTP